MRRKSRACFWALSASILLLLFLTACGGDNNNNTSVGPPATVTLSPTSASLTAGDVLPMSVSVLDAQQRAVFNAPVTFSSDRPEVQIANNGALCAGTWDSLTSPVVCTPAAPGAAGILAKITATAGSITSTAVNVFVHLRVTSIDVTPLNPPCVAQGGTVQFSAIAKGSVNGVLTDITASVGNINWQVQTGQVASGDPLSTPGKTGGSDPTTVTAKLPGRTPVIATVNTIGTVTSVPATFTECPIAKITVTAPTTDLTGAGNTVQLTAVATDTTGADVTNPAPTLIWASNPIAVATVNASGLVTGQVGGTAALVAGCVGTCNIGLEPIFSEVTPIKVAGTSSTTVYAASKDSSSLIPITTSNNTAGTAIALPNSQKPNSLVFSPNGARAFLGSDGGLMVIDATNNTVAANVTNAIGKVLAVSPDGNQVLISDVGAGALRVFNGSANTVTNLVVLNATAADFSPDGSKAYIAAGNRLFILQAGSIPSLPAVPSNPTANNVALDVSFLASGNSAYLVLETPSPVTRSTSRVRTCNNSITEAIGGAPRLLKALPDGTQVLEAEDANINAVDVTVNPATSGSSACPSIVENVTQHSAATSGAPQQLMVTLDSSKAFVTSTARLGSLLAYDVAGGATSTIALAGSTAATAGTTTGGVTLDSKTLYVGGTDNAVHVIDISTATDTAQVPLTFTPDLVAVRPH